MFYARLATKQPGHDGPRTQLASVVHVSIYGLLPSTTLEPMSCAAN